MNMQLIPEAQAKYGVWGKEMTLGQIALVDPQLGRALYERHDGALGAYSDAPAVQMLGGWELLNITGTWTSGAANQAVVGDLSGIVEADLWIHMVKYTVQRPNAFAGSIFKSLADEMNKLNPNVNVQLLINSLCRYLPSPDISTPLENILEMFECSCPTGLVLTCGASIEATFTNLRALASDENPTHAVITLSATRLPRGSYSSCGYADSIKRLRDAGLLSPQSCP